MLRAEVSKFNIGSLWFLYPLIIYFNLLFIVNLLSQVSFARNTRAGGNLLFIVNLLSLYYISISFYKVPIPNIKSDLEGERSDEYVMQNLLLPMYTIEGYPRINSLSCGNDFAILIGAFQWFKFANTSAFSFPVDTFKYPSFLSA